MRSYQNPFRLRASEQVGDVLAFLRNFGAGALELLPASLWDRPVVLRSAPGGGKTSLMRLFTFESLAVLHRRRDEFPALVEQLEQLEALSADGPRHLGILLNLDRDYPALLDLELRPEQLNALFFRLLDARILRSTVHAITGHYSLENADQLQLRPRDPPPETDAALSAFEDLSGASLLEWARANERAALRQLDSLLPVPLEFGGEPVAPLVSLRLLSTTRLQVRGEDLALRPLIMLDDGHELGRSQRAALLERLVDRTLDVGRWYSERLEALEDDDLLVGDTRGRDYEVVELETRARELHGRYEQMMLDIADRRARPYLREYAQIEQPFTELLDVDTSELLEGRTEEILDVLRARLAELAASYERFQGWIEHASHASGYGGAVLLRALEIAIQKDLGRPQSELFEVVRSFEEFEGQRARVMPAARHFLAREFHLPYYAGADMLARLGSENAEQFLRVAGDVFEQMLGHMTLRELPRLTAREQDTVVRRASDRYWRELPQRVVRGRQARRLVAAIVDLCQADTFRETAPYSPGVTGTALSMSDRDRLTDPAARSAVPGGQELYDALTAALAANVLTAKPDYSSKNQRVMVIYLNRLLCPRFNLPLGRGGFRERKLETMAGWMTGERAGAEDKTLEVQIPDQLVL